MRVFCWAAAIGAVIGYALLALVDPVTAEGCGGHFSVLMVGIVVAIVATHRERLL